MSQTKAQLIDTLVASLLPASDSSVDIGSNGVRFANIYGDTLYGSGANLTGLNIVTDTSPQLGGLLDSNGQNIKMLDSNIVYFGTGNDSAIFHTGAHLFIQNATGQLRIQGAPNEDSVVAIANAATELYYDNSKKFETISGGVQVTGELYADGVRVGDDEQIRFGNDEDLRLYHSGSHGILNNITGSFQVQDAGTEKFRVSGTGTFFKDDIHLSNDNDKLNFGAGNDLQIYSNGVAGIIDHVTTGTGADLILRSKTIVLRNLSNESMIVGNQNGAVQLYYDNSKKFETTSAGVTMSGNIFFPDQKEIQLGGNTDLRLYHDGHSIIRNDETGAAMFISSHETIMANTSFSEAQAKFIQNGAVELYYDNSKKFETTSAGIDVTGRVTADDLTVENTTGNLSAMFTATNGLGTLEIGGSTGAFIDLKTPQTDDFDLRIGTDGTAGYILAAGTGIISIQGHPTPSANNTYDIGSNTNKWKEIFSTKFIHRYGTSGSATPNEQEAIWYGGGITVMHDNATLSTSNYTWGLTGSRGYALLRIRNNAGSPQAIYAEAGSITSGSDYRMKENIEEITNGIETVKKLKPSIYNIRKTFNPNDDGKKHHGFVAHEVQEAIPNIGNIVSGTKDAMEEVFYEDEDENIPAGKKAGDSTGTFTDKPDYQGIDYGHMTPILAAAIKELITKVETLESENTSLKTRVTTLESA